MKNPRNCLLFSVLLHSSAVFSLPQNANLPPSGVGGLLMNSSTTVSSETKTSTSSAATLSTANSVSTTSTSSSTQPSPTPAQVSQQQQQQPVGQPQQGQQSSSPPAQVLKPPGSSQVVVVQVQQHQQQPQPQQHPQQRQPQGTAGKTYGATAPAAGSYSATVPAIDEPCDDDEPVAAVTTSQKPTTTTPNQLDEPCDDDDTPPPPPSPLPAYTPQPVAVAQPALTTPCTQALAAATPAPTAGMYPDTYPISTANAQLLAATSTLPNDGTLSNPTSAPGSDSNTSNAAPASAGDTVYNSALYPCQSVFLSLLISTAAILAM